MEVIYGNHHRSSMNQTESNQQEQIESKQSMKSVHLHFKFTDQSFTKLHIWHRRVKFRKILKEILKESRTSFFLLLLLLLPSVDVLPFSSVCLCLNVCVSVSARIFQESKSILSMISLTHSKKEKNAERERERVGNWKRIPSEL